MPWISRRALREQAAAMTRLRWRVTDAERALRTAEMDALTGASAAIDAAIDRILAEHPVGPAMKARILGMRAAQRLVAGLPEEETG